MTFLCRAQTWCTRKNFILKRGITDKLKTLDAIEDVIASDEALGEYQRQQALAAREREGRRHRKSGSGLGIECGGIR